jgi:hypothetical protein
MARIVAQTQRVLKKIDRTLSGPLSEFSEQFLYGHREILCSYANLGDKAMIKGSVEHGWAMDSGLGIPRIPFGRYLHLSWSSERIARSQVTHPQTVAIGAPFIYAHELVKHKLNSITNETSSPRRKILFFPVHGNEFSQQNASSQINLFKEKYKPTDATVCLYWVEFVNPQIYGAYNQAGFQVVCAGFSGQMEHTGLGFSARRLAGSPIGGRPVFILRTIGLLSQYDTVVMGGLGSICFYAAYMKKNFEILHGYYQTSYLDMDYEHGNNFENNPDEIRYRKYISDFVGDVFENIDFNGLKFRELAEIELGKRDMRSPVELKKLLTPHLVHVANSQSLKVFEDAIENYDQILTMN